MERHFNYLLFVPSPVTKMEPVIYQAAVEGIGDTVYPKYAGLQTNEAVTKFLVDYLNNAGECLDKIIMLCTKEVLEDHLPQIGGKTTYDYYTKEIEKYIQEQNYTNMIDMANLFEPVPYFPENNENENQIITKLEQIVKPKEENNCSKRLFVDFTSGNRSSALTMVFSCRILDQYGVKMGKILYSNLRGNVIEECTKTYQIFSAFERNLMIENGIINERPESEKENGENSDIDITRKALKRAQNLNLKEDVEKLTKKLDKLVESEDTESMGYVNKRSLEATKEWGKKIQKEEKDSLLKIKNCLERNDYTEALKQFRENIIKILHASSIIEISEKRYKKKNGEMNYNLVADEIAAVYYYYEGEPNSQKHTFLHMIKEYIHALHDNPKTSPIEIKETYFGEDYLALHKYIDQVPSWGFKHNSFSKSKSNEKIIPYLEKERNQELESCIKKYSDMDWLYMGYGFPFACTYGGEKYFHGYDELYWENFENGVNSLQEFFEGTVDKKMKHIVDSFSTEISTYEDVVEALCAEQDEEKLRMLFPFQLRSANIKSKTLDWTSWKNFIYNFAQAYCVIKSVRNGAIHLKDMQNKEIKRAFDELKEVIGQIEDIKNNIGQN